MDKFVDSTLDNTIIIITSDHGEEWLDHKLLFHGTSLYEELIKVQRELRELAASPLVTIGAHSHCHNILTQLPASAVAESLATSKQLLETWTGRPVRHFAYPNGDHDAAVISQVKSAGFESAMTTVARPWTRDDSPFTIPRIGVGRYDSAALFKAKVSGAWRTAPAHRNPKPT